MSEARDPALPAWSLQADEVSRARIEPAWTDRVDREWAFAGATGRGVSVCVLDSGVERGHPRVGAVARAVAIDVDGEGFPVAVEDREGDVAGHGTACAGIVRSLAPEAELYSVRVLGGLTGAGQILVAGLEWAVAQGYDVINISLSTTRREFAEKLWQVADRAYFKRTVLVASAHNIPVDSYPWRFSSVISVGSHEEPDPFVFYANPSPPVEFFARGVDVEVAWSGGGTMRATGNSFATPTMSAICALVLSKHPNLTPFQLKSVLYLIASNVGHG